ncbi:MAG TPA: ATP-binding protein [Gammaproteobacteria bacterium]|nr:ATP-binding protein [Gammaproteobacteria bacterium]
MKFPRFNLSLKLFLVVFLTSLLAIVVMSTAMRLGFQQGFLNFLNDLELRRLAALEQVLERAYVAEGGWDFLRGNPRNWQVFLQRYWRAEELQSRLTPPGMRAMPPPSPNLLARISLLDAQQRFVAGPRPPEKGARLRPLESRGEVIGFLAVQPIQAFTEAAEVAFLQQQLDILIISAAFTAALAAIAAFILTRLYVRPLRLATRSIRALADGNYDMHLAESNQDDIGRLYGDINHLGNTLARNERLRREFTADIAHELRTPLAILRGELEAIEDGVRPMNEQTLESLRGELEQLGKLVDALHELQLTDKGALAYRKHRIDLAALIRDSHARFAERLNAAGIEVELDLHDGLIINGDSDQLGRLFGNLFENSLRYTAGPGKLRVALRGEDNGMIIDFLDSAPGVTDADLPRLFERMFRAEASRNRASGGHGLGLAICQNIVAAHRGGMEARHSPLGGLWLRITLPADTGEQQT